MTYFPTYFQVYTLLRISLTNGTSLTRGVVSLCITTCPTDNDTALSWRYLPMSVKPWQCSYISAQTLSTSPNLRPLHATVCCMSAHKHSQAKLKTSTCTFCSSPSKQSHHSNGLYAWGLAPLCTTGKQAFQLKTMVWKCTGNVPDYFKLSSFISSTGLQTYAWRNVHMYACTHKHKHTHRGLKCMLFQLILLLSNLTDLQHHHNDCYHMS